MASAELLLVRELIALRWANRAMSIAERRAQYDSAEETFAAHAPRPGRQVDAGGCPAEWVVPPVAGEPVVLYLHGGGYLLGSPRSHRHLAAAIGRAAGAAVLAADYRLAPEHAFPAAVDDASAACRWLLDGGREVVVCGDSAGGGLALATALALREAPRRPFAIACLSPWVDLTCSAASYTACAERDPLLHGDELRRMAAAYLGGADPRHPLASPLHADLHGLPPLLILAGSDEILRDDARALAAAGAVAGVAVTFEEWPEMIHVWPWWFPVLAEGQRAIDAIGRFVRACASAAHTA